MIFVEHVLCIKYVLQCAEHGEPLWKPLTFVGIVILLMAILMIPDGYYGHTWSYRAKPRLYQALKEQMFEKAAQIDLSCYDDPKYYNDFVLAVAESETSVDRFLDLLRSTVINLTTIITSGIFFLVENPVGLIFVFISFILTFVSAGRLNRLNYNARMDVNPQERKRNYSGRVFYLNDYAKEIRLHPEAGKLIRESFEEANQEVCNIQKKYGGKRMAISFLRNYVFSDFVVNGLYVAYLVYVAAVLKRIDYSTAVVLFNTIDRLRNSMRRFAELFPKAGENSLYIDKIKNFLRLEPTISAGMGQTAKPGTRELCLNNVSFRYTEDSPEILHNISLKVKPGEHIAIVGYNGAGKTTLIKLLLRLYDPSEGSIVYGDDDIRNLDVKEYRDRFGVVFQDYKMYGASLAENVVLSDKSLTKTVCEEVRAALEKSGFGERLAQMERGLETPITTEFDENGINLSGGEGQKVAIARAFYKDADILAMDEPSSALDPIAEYNLNKAMHDAAQGKTVFYISHRLSTTRNADRIIMLEKGRIIEEGTHEQLLLLNGEYAKMWHAQAGKYASL